jgi:hypothetical protein
MISPRSAISTAPFPATEGKGSPRAPWSGRVRVLGLGCYVSVGLAVLALLVIR